MTWGHILRSLRYFWEVINMKSRGRSKMILELFSNPAKNQIGTSLWLLVYSVLQFKDKGGQLDQIENTLNRSLKRVRSQDKRFFLMWRSGYDLDDVLHRFTEIGVLEERIDEKLKNPIWKVSEKGR